LERRAKKKKAQESKKEPPFVIGIVHHHLYSPVLTTNITSEKKKKTAVQAQQNTNIKKGITKATEKRLLAKAANVETKQKTLTTSAKKKSATNDKSVKKLESFAPPNDKFNPPAGLFNIIVTDATDEEEDKNNFPESNKLKTIQIVCNNPIESITLKLSPNKLETSNNNTETLPLEIFSHTCATQKKKKIALTI